MNFPERLRLLRNQTGTTQAKIAEVLGITTRAIRKYETADAEPTLSKLIALSNYFDVSLDYIVGLSDNPVRH